MDFSSPGADATALLLQPAGALLFGMVFLFLWRQSRVVYFGLWSIAWLLRLVAAIFVYANWMGPYAVFEFSFAILLVAAARAGFGSEIKDWRTVLRPMAIPAILAALVCALGFLSRPEAYGVSHAAVLCFAYFYNFATLRRNEGMGGRIFRFSLLALAAALLGHATSFLYLYHAGNAPEWARYLHRETYYDFALHCVLAFSAMAMWSETQTGRIRELQSELDQLRRETRRNTDLDRLTGLRNQAALARRVEGGAEYPGVIAVCDMDNFKDINDRYGHLVGDEILRHIGNLLQASIRQEDEAYRWGGDEFVILFLNQFPEVAAKRMAELESRLQAFRVRGFGTLPISVSWGTADGRGRPLRDALDEADRSMYAVKRSRAAESDRDRRQGV
jgi:diguanylate cyclase (GGDEF)-like protein